MDIQKWCKEQKPAECITDEEMKRSMDSVHDFKVFAAGLAKEFNITHRRDIDWHNFCAGLLTYFEQNKQAEWSEAEKDKVIRYLHERDGGMLWTTATIIANDICGILHPRPHWKPSEEQMKALYEATNLLAYNGKETHPLRSLHKELQALL